jgi:hypothetical protein
VCDVPADGHTDALVKRTSAKPKAADENADALGWKNETSPRVDEHAIRVKPRGKGAAAGRTDGVIGECRCVFAGKKPAPTRTVHRDCCLPIR